MNEQDNSEPVVDDSTVAIPEATPFEKYRRDKNGLIPSVEYHFNEDGSVNWRAMIKPEYLYPNRDFFDNRKLSVPDSIDGLDDKQLLIMLAGLKELAKLRGFSSVTYEVKNVDDAYVVAKCKITWLSNYETPSSSIFGSGVVFEDVGNATRDNTDNFCLKFLETIACNRAFVRCVRNFLNIHIVGADEIDKSKNKVADISDLVVSNALPVTPQGTLEKAVNEKLKIQDFEGFKVFLREVYKGAKEAENTALLTELAGVKDWSGFKDISGKTSRVLLKIVNENKKDS